MASNFWIKLYHEILHDPKMGRLPDNVWRRAIELFLLAGELDDSGKLPNTEDIAWLLHRPSIEEFEAELIHLEKVKILTRLDDGWLVTKFTERQKAISDAERAKAYRDRKRKEPVLPESNEPVTPETQERHEPVTNRDADIDKDININISGKKPLEPIEEKSKGPKTLVKDAFLESSKLPWPGLKKEQSFWWGQFGEIAKIFDNDPDKAVKATQSVIEYMRHQGLSIVGPKSIVNLCRQVAGGQPLSNGRDSPGSDGVVEIKTVRATDGGFNL